MINRLYRRQNFEILFVCILSGIGMIYSGYILDTWQLSRVFKENDELWIVITPLLGLKGNIEMTLASRLSTIIKLNKLKNSWKMSYKNILIVQIQGIIVGLGAAVIGYTINVMINFAISFNQLVRLIWICVLTAAISSFILGTLTILLVINSWKLRLDPDNIATPLAAAMGDTVTLFILLFIAKCCPIEAVTNIHYTILGVIFFIYLPFLLAQIKWKDLPNWLPILIGMICSSLSGLILKRFLFRINLFATFQPLVNGVGGNLASIFSSLLSTYCHQIKNVNNFNEFNGLFGTLIISNLVIHVVLLSLCMVLKFISMDSVISIICPYFVTVTAQIIVILAITRCLVRKLWVNGINPDNNAIPLITGMGDFCGTLFLCCGLLAAN